MQIAGVDERDSSWESHRPRFRVYFFIGGESGRPWATNTYDVTDADVLEVLQWAQEQAGNECLYAVALVTEEAVGTAGPQRGLMWLVGTDANDTATDEAQQHSLTTMRQRQGQRLVALR